MAGGVKQQQVPRDQPQGMCRRCLEREPTTAVRTEPVCQDCFGKYVHTKVVKRMEPFRVRNSEPGKEPVLLLPLSLGVCSLALLHTLSQHRKGQVGRTGRTGFDLHVLHVRRSDDDAVEPSMFEETKARYPEHSYSICGLSDVLALDPSITDLFPSSLADQPAALPSRDRLDALLATLGSATSRADVLQLLLVRLVVILANQTRCEAVLWGDSTTRLAERTLAETAKGRGFALPWIVAEGASPHAIPFHYPMREVLTKEIAAFAAFAEPPLIGLKDQTASVVSSKGATIDSLMKQYFASVEREFPSIVANVVRTTAKLRPTPLAQVERQCELCNMPLEGQAPERSRLCYACIRILPLDPS